MVYWIFDCSDDRPWSFVQESDTTASSCRRTYRRRKELLIVFAHHSAAAHTRSGDRLHRVEFCPTSEDGLPLHARWSGYELAGSWTAPPGVLQRPTTWVLSLSRDRVEQRRRVEYDRRVARIPYCAGVVSDQLVPIGSCSCSIAAARRDLSPARAPNRQSDDRPIR